MCQRYAAVLVAVTTSLLIAVPSTATIWNVNPQGTGDVPTIQAGFDAAVPGDTILLAPGTYRDAHTRSLVDWGTTSTTTAIAFMAPGVSITSSAGADATILDGEWHHHGLVGGDLGVVEVSGITFLDCRPTGSGGLLSFTGSGLMILRSSPVVERNIFRACAAYGGGGASGLYLIESAGGAVRLNLFQDNIAGDIGGAVGILECFGTAIELNTFVDNLAFDGGGAIEVNFSEITFDNNILAGNEAGNVAGGLLCLGGSTVVGSCNLLWDNHAPQHNHVTPGCLTLGADNNLVTDPLFCDPPSDDFTLHSDSPAAPGHPSGCGQRGAFGVGCGPVALTPQTWARMKARYR